MTKWDYKNGLPPLKKAKLGDEFEFLESEEIFKTNIDGFPYIVLESFTQELNKKDKFSIEGEQGMYTVTSVDLDRKTLEAKLDKVLDLTERLVGSVQDYYDGFGIRKVAKCNHLIGNVAKIELDVEGKLSKNQTVQLYSRIIKITDLVKNYQKEIEIKGVDVEYKTLTPVYPYKEYKDVLGWFYCWGDMLLHKAREFNKRRNGGI